MIHLREVARKAFSVLEGDQRTLYRRAYKNKMIQPTLLVAKQPIHDDDNKAWIVHRIKQQEFSLLEKACTAMPNDFAHLGEYNIYSARSLVYPLHYLCRSSRNCPVSTLRTLMLAAPKALEYQDSLWGSTPLHLACSSAHMSIQCIQELIRACPKSLTIADVDGKLPVHVAATHANADVVMALWKAHPTSQVTNRQQTVLHLAVQRADADANVVKTLFYYFESQDEWKSYAKNMRKFKGLRRILRQ